MFEESYRTLFLSTPAKLFHRNNSLYIQKEQCISIPLKDIANIVIDTPQIVLNSSLLNAFAQNKILVFVCDASHLPSGILTPFLPHYKNAQIIEKQIYLTKQKKAILWQQIIKAKIQNQVNLLKMLQQEKVATKLEVLQKSVRLCDGTNNEAKASRMYFPALFGKGFVREMDCIENAALNYGYAIVRGSIARNIVISGLLPTLGIFHHNQFNAFNLADDLIEPYRIFVDSRIKGLKLDKEMLDGAIKATLVDILHTRVLLDGKFYPLYRAIPRSVWSLVDVICKGKKELSLPVFDRGSDGREFYESFSDV
ncbi:type II CRISPR-associated endonuclease Cas1 [Helicobacter sp. faydin-H20]|uniref:type II CRISPR-associated endonuclease Cas1 n=1 Tax=Helicobacter anatolicus TaxID=2905874 RepID=UPI001E5DB8E1|nr:type II CRISPR-associated endonuclease Cas1 [Helicobacter anatolicus]